MILVTIKNPDKETGNFSDKVYPVLHIFDNDRGYGIRFILPDDNGEFRTVTIDKTLWSAPERPVYPETYPEEADFMEVVEELEV